MSSADNSSQNEQFDQKKASGSRKKGFIGLALVIVVAAGGYGAYWHFIGSKYMSTDNAYAAAEVAEVTPATSGIVSKVNVVASGRPA